MNPLAQTDINSAKTQFHSECNLLGQNYKVQAFETCKTVRPYKNVKNNKPFAKVNCIFFEQTKTQEKSMDRRKSNQQQMSHSGQICQNTIFAANNYGNKIPSTYQSDILWKTQISQSFIQKLEEFQSSSQLQADQNNRKNQKNKEKMRNLQNQVMKLRLYAKEMSQKVVEMHKVYSEGNRKSIELVMLIVKQLQKQNKTLKQKISSMNLLSMAQSIRSNQTENSSPQKQKLQKDFNQNKVSPFNQAKYSTQNQYSDSATQKPSQTNKQMESSRISNVQELQVNQKYGSQSPLNDSPVQGSPVWSVLLTGDNRLQTIKQLQHEDDSYSVNENIQNCAFNHTFSSKLGRSGRLSDFNDQNISHFHVQTIQKTVIEKKDQQAKQPLTKCQQNSYQKHLFDQAVLKLKTHENSYIEQIQDDDQEQSLIVKKLLKLNKIQRKSNVSQNFCLPQISQQNPTNSTPQATLNQAFQQNITQINKLHDPFSGIYLSHFSTENQNSIFQALSILKEYSSEEGFNLSVLSETQGNKKKIVKAKFPPKISLVASKKIIKNKENLPQ